MRFGSLPVATCSLFGLISSCQFFWITFVTHRVEWRGAFARPTPPRGKSSAASRLVVRPDEKSFIRVGACAAGSR